VDAQILRYKFKEMQLNVNSALSFPRENCNFIFNLPPGLGFLTWAAATPCAADVLLDLQHKELSLSASWLTYILRIQYV